MSILPKIERITLSKVCCLKEIRNRIKNASLISYSKKCNDEDEDEWDTNFKRPNQMVIEKSCEPCSFQTWKMKPPKPIVIRKPSKQEKKRKERRCYAGMQPKKTVTVKDEKEQADKRWTRLHPSRTARCAKEKESDEQPVSSGGKYLYGRQSKLKNKLDCPLSDWDHKGHYE